MFNYSKKLCQVLYRCSFLHPTHFHYTPTPSPPFIKIEMVYESFRFDIFREKFFLRKHDENTNSAIREKSNFFEIFPKIFSLTSQIPTPSTLTVPPTPTPQSHLILHKLGF